MALENDIFDLQSSVNFVLRGAAMSANLVLRRELQRTGFKITPEQALVMFVLFAEDGISQGELADRVGKDRPTVTRILDLLEKHGSIERRRSAQDRRVYQVFVTERARQRHEEAQPIFHEVEQRILDGFSEDEVQTFFRMCFRIIENCRRQSEN